ncbi:hypothetical protein Klosneuvirus_4_135 [Klosneuvirus KNV1]|uniref:Uncharacterized protein n=1 Tax=Klosneuvirus KNV1 TaxID=1977640 RepID=A0A1V0SKR5_9VIRU|nr:hypothetical protein Klosneuvirus_4_135 [Klosneuvirus KNV1]
MAHQEIIKTVPSHLYTGILAIFLIQFYSFMAILKYIFSYKWMILVFNKHGKFIPPIDTHSAFRGGIHDMLMFLPVPFTEWMLPKELRESSVIRDMFYMCVRDTLHEVRIYMKETMTRNNKDYLAYLNAHGLPDEVELDPKNSRGVFVSMGDGIVNKSGVYMIPIFVLVNLIKYCPTDSQLRLATVDEIDAINGEYPDKVPFTGSIVELMHKHNLMKTGVRVK